MRRFVLLALLAVPASLTSQGAADEPGIYGYVLAPGDVPVSDGTVVYSSLAAPGSTSIDRSGRFRIPGDRVGLYRVTVTVPGFAPYQFRVTTPASRSVRLPVIHLEPATHLRVRFVSPTGEPITSPVIRRRSFDGSGAPILDAPVSNAIERDADEATRIGPLPHGITALALDMPAFAQTRLPNISVTGADALLDGGTIVVQPGSRPRRPLMRRERHMRPPAFSHPLLSLLCSRGPCARMRRPGDVRSPAAGQVSRADDGGGRCGLRNPLPEPSGVASAPSTRIVAAKRRPNLVAAGPVKGIVVSALPITSLRRPRC